MPVGHWCEVCGIRGCTRTHTEAARTWAATLRRAGTVLTRGMAAAARRTRKEG